MLELVKSNYVTDQILCSKEFYEVNEADLENLKSSIVSEKILMDAGTFKTNSSCLAVGRSQEHEVADIDCQKQIFALDGVNDPGNLGTIIRTLDWFGFDQLVCSHNSAELYNPKVINSTMGSFTKIKVIYTDVEGFISQSALPAYGAEMNGSSLFESKLKKPSIVVMGSESHGISSQVKAKLNSSVTVPKYGKAESLNVAIATGIIASYLRMC